MSKDILDRLRDWSEHDEGKINDTREDAACVIERLRKELDVSERKAANYYKAYCNEAKKNISPYRSGEKNEQRLD